LTWLELGQLFEQVSIIAFPNAISVDGRIRISQFEQSLPSFPQFAEGSFALFIRCFRKIAFSELGAMIS